MRLKSSEGCRPKWRSRNPGTEGALLKPISPSDQDAWSLVVICRHRHHGSISEKFRQGVDALGHFFAAQFLTVRSGAQRNACCRALREDNFCHNRHFESNYRVGPGLGPTRLEKVLLGELQGSTRRLDILRLLKRRVNIIASRNPGPCAPLRKQRSSCLSAG